jgi:hypothetical protein
VTVEKTRKHFVFTCTLIDNIHLIGINVFGFLSMNANHIKKSKGEFFFLIKTNADGLLSDHTFQATNHCSKKLKKCVPKDTTSKCI